MEKHGKISPFSTRFYPPVLTTLWISVDNSRLSTKKLPFLPLASLTDRKMKKVIHNLSTIFRRNGEKRQNTTFFSLFEKQVKKTYQQKQEHLFITQGRTGRSEKRAKKGRNKRSQAAAQRVRPTRGAKAASKQKGGARNGGRRKADKNRVRTKGRRPQRRGRQ